MNSVELRASVSKMAALSTSDGEDSDTGVEEDLSRDLNSLRAALAQERDTEGESGERERKALSGTCGLAYYKPIIKMSASFTTKFYSSSQSPCAVFVILTYPTFSSPASVGGECGGEGGGGERRVLENLRQCLDSNLALRHSLHQQIAKIDAALAENEKKQVDLSTKTCSIMQFSPSLSPYTCTCPSPLPSSPNSALAAKACWTS